MKKLGKVLSFIDNHHKETFYLILALTVISEILFIFYHTPAFGYANATIEENLYNRFILEIAPTLRNNNIIINVVENENIREENIVGIVDFIIK